MPKKIKINGVIYSWEVSEIEREIESAKGEDLFVEISSPGGYIYAGIKLYNIFNNYPGQVHTHNMGLAASMGSIILLAGNKVTAESASVFMMHNASMYEGGDYRDFAKNAKYLEGLTDMLAKIYAKKTGKALADIRALMDDETYYFGEESRDAGFVDEITAAPANSAAPMSRNAAISWAKLEVGNSITEMNAQIKERDDLEKAAALCPAMIATNIKPRNQAEKTQKTEVKKMDLATFLTENPAEKAVYDANMKAQFDAGSKVGTDAVEARIKKAAPYLTDTAEKSYPVAVKTLAVKVLSGESDHAALEGAVTMWDATEEERKTAAAALEAKGETPPGNQDAGALSEDGVIRNDADFDAALARE